MRPIDADAFEEEARNSLDMQDLYLPIHIKELVIDDMPTVDAVPVVRCKDCIHNVSNRITDPLCLNDYSGDDIVCDYFETDGMEPDDYCSYAERKEE